MSTHAFLGPSLSLPSARAIAPSVAYHPPASLGDVYQLTRTGAETILIIDGLFDSLPPVWHKEILYAMSCGSTVAGCASMGALRAAELHRFGMIGLGTVFEQYRDGRLTDDDEVTVTHAPAEFGYRCISTAMIDIRYALSRAERDGIISPETSELACSRAKQMFFPERNWKDIIQSAVAAGAPSLEAADLLTFVQASNLSIKAEDAANALAVIAADTLPRSEPRAAVRPAFERTNAWNRFEQVFSGPDIRPVEYRLGSPVS
jgi:hypothetical protein